jgi:TatD DNase family protein
MSATFTDTHTHLYSEDFDHDRNIIIQNAINLGVNRFFIPAIDSSCVQKMYDLEAEFPENVFLMAGLHPCYVKGNFEEELRLIEKQLSTRKFVAIGEIGIDLYWDKTTLEIQKQAFRHQIQLAKKYRLPINIHCRDSFDEVFEVLSLEKSGDLYGIFHCFSGTLEQALQAISFNMKLGIGGVVTFKNGKIDQFLSQIPIENIVLETDAPYLAPVPFRGKRNESAYIPIIAEKLASIYNLSIDEIARITTENSKMVFGI